MDGDLFLGVLDRLAAGDDTLAKLTASLGKDQQSVADAVGWAVGSTLVTKVAAAGGERLELTPQGQMVVSLRAQAMQSNNMSAFAIDVDFGSTPRVDLSAMAAEIAHAWSTAQGVQNPEFQLVQKGLLVGDQEREAATTTLEEAFAAGRVDKAELDRRTQLALNAKTRGDLDGAIEGLVDPWGAVTGARDASVSRWIGLARWIAVGVTAGVVLLVLVVVLVVLLAFP